MGAMMDMNEARSVYKHPRYPEFTAMLQAKAMMLGVDVKHGIGYASHTFTMGPIGNIPSSDGRVDATTMQPLSYKEWDQRVSGNYGASVFLEWLKENPVTNGGNDGGNGDE